MGFITANHIAMHYQISGLAGKPQLVLINSLGSDLHIWDRFLPLMQNDYQILRYDIRGHGLSDVVAPPYSMDQLAEDLISLLDALGWNNAVNLVGLSIGGLIAQYCAAHWSDRVARLILMDTAAKIGTQDSWDTRIRDVEEHGIAAITETILSRWFAPDFQKNEPSNYAGARNMLLRTPVAGYIGCCAALRDSDLQRTTAKLNLPTQVIAGEYDGSTPPDLVKATASLINKARFTLIANAGHIPCFEQPQITAQIIDNFIKESGCE